MAKLLMTAMVVAAMGLCSVAWAQQPEAVGEEGAAEQGGAEQGDQAAPTEEDEARRAAAARARAKAAERREAAAGENRGERPALSPERARLLRERRAKRTVRAVRGEEGRTDRAAAARARKARLKAAGRAIRRPETVIRQVERRVVSLENQHNQRVAKLKRIRELAAQADDTKTVEKVDALLKSESQSHAAAKDRLSTRLKKLKDARDRRKAAQAERNTKRGGERRGGEGR